MWAAVYIGDADCVLVCLEIRGAGRWMVCCSVVVSGRWRELSCAVGGLVLLGIGYR